MSGAFMAVPSTYGWFIPNFFFGFVVWFFFACILRVGFFGILKVVASVTRRTTFSQWTWRPIHYLQMNWLSLRNKIGWSERFQENYWLSTSRKLCEKRIAAVFSLWFFSAPWSAITKQFFLVFFFVLQPRFQKISGRAIHFWKGIFKTFLTLYYNPPSS